MRSKLKTWRLYIYIYLRMAHLVDLGYSFQIRVHIFIFILPPPPCTPSCVCIHVSHICSEACVLVDTHVHYVEVRGRLFSSREDFSLNLELTDLWGQPAAELWAWVSVTPRRGQVSSIHLASYAYLGSKLMLEQHTHCPVSISLQPGQNSFYSAKFTQFYSNFKTTRNLQILQLVTLTKRQVRDTYCYPLHCY